MRPRVAQAAQDLDLAVPKDFTEEHVRKQAAKQPHGVGTGWFQKPDPGYCLFPHCNGKKFKYLDAHVTRKHGQSKHMKGNKEI